jgi:leucyl-tRNA synthetase
MFAAPPEHTLEWSESSVEGQFRFLKKLWRLVSEHVNATAREVALEVTQLDDEQKALRRQVHQTIAKASDDVGRRYTFNTAIAAVMELTNALQKCSDKSDQGYALMKEALEACVLLLAPIVPHITHALWGSLGHEGPIVDEPWPTIDPLALKQDTVELVVQVNGKLRAHVTASSCASRQEVEKIALDDPNVRRFIDGGEVRKVIVVPGKLVNIVV